MKAQLIAVLLTAIVHAASGDEACLEPLHLDKPLMISDIMNGKGIEGLSLGIPQFRFSEESFVEQRFDHSSFDTALSYGGGNMVYGTDTFDFWGKLDEKGRVSIHWRFENTYPNKPGMYGPKDVWVTGVLLSFRW